ncbi:MAG: hypothetical protein KGI50_05700 [Patescibacteria group bacterium]|nr:hypothetical protein [Patescibacteria group bacterium]MDE1971037.1 hypothetical protein [Patescibacteria group bacterium]
MKTKDRQAFNALNGKGSERADRLHRFLMESGFDFATGVPCGVLKHIIANLVGDKRVCHVPANRESEAIGLAAGAYLAGKKPLVYMQNSGLFAASNDIASLLVPYGIPALMLISYRGCEGEDAVQHLTTGHATENLIRSFNLPYEVFDGRKRDINACVSVLIGLMTERELPAILLLKRGWYV